jgi:hypothetical protein
MILMRIVVTGLLVLGASAPVRAADHCLSRNEQKARTASHAVVPLSRAMRPARQHGEIINARLCERGGHLVYLLTVLGRDGKVALASIDAGNGALIGMHGEEKKSERAEDKKQDVRVQEKQDKQEEKKPEKK